MDDISEEKMIRLCEQVSSRSGLPEALCRVMFSCGWTYSEHTNGERKWIKPPQPTLVIQPKT